MILEEIGALLQTAGIGAITTTIILHALVPPGPMEGDPPEITLIELAGRAPVRALELPPSRYEQPVVHVLTRSAPYRYTEARLKAQEAWEVLDGIGNQVLSGTRYLWVQALLSPHWIKDDELGRSHIVFDILCARAL